MRGRAWIVALAAAAVGGCGGEPTLSSSAADELHAQVAAVREAAGTGDRNGALDALDRLQARVRELQDDGSLADGDATMLRRGIGQARRRVRAEVAEAVPTPTPEATAEPVPEDESGGEPGTGNDEQKGKGKGKGKGNEEKKAEEKDD